MPLDILAVLGRTRRKAVRRSRSAAAVINRSTPTRHADSGAVSGTVSTATPLRGRRLEAVLDDAFVPARGAHVCTDWTASCSAAEAVERSHLEASAAEKVVKTLKVPTVGIGACRRPFEVVASKEFTNLVDSSWTEEMPSSIAVERDHVAAAAVHQASMLPFRAHLNDGTSETTTRASRAEPVVATAAIRGTDRIPRCADGETNTPSCTSRSSATCHRSCSSESLPGSRCPSTPACPRASIRRRLMRSPTHISSTKCCRGDSVPAAPLPVPPLPQARGGTPARHLLGPR